MVADAAAPPSSVMNSRRLIMKIPNPPDRRIPSSFGVETSIFAEGRAGSNHAVLIAGGMSAPVQVFGRRQDEAVHALMRPAFEKRQGTKSREVGHPAVPRVLWGFGDGVGLDEVGAERLPRSVGRKSRVSTAG
jgi:hypothetical protein